MRDNIADIIDDLVGCGAPKPAAELAVAAAYMLGVAGAVYRQEVADVMAQEAAKRGTTKWPSGRRIA